MADRKPYLFSTVLSVIWVCLVLALVAGALGWSYLHRQAGETVCETTARTYGLNDGCP